MMAMTPKAILIIPLEVSQFKMSAVPRPRESWKCDAGFFCCEPTLQFGRPRL